MLNCEYCGSGIDGATCPNCAEIRQDLYKISGDIDDLIKTIPDKSTRQRLRRIGNRLIKEILIIRETRITREASGL